MKKMVAESKLLPREDSISLLVDVSLTIQITNEPKNLLLHFM